MLNMKQRITVIRIQNNFQQLFHTSSLREGCVVCKQHKISFFHGNNSWTKVKFVLIHFDTCDPRKTKSLNRSIYFVTFIDDDFWFITIYFSRQHLMCSQCFGLTKPLLKFKHEMKCLRFNNGGVHKNNDIDWQYIFSYALKQNGVLKKKIALCLKFPTTCL
jgi:hypothetical protein